MSQCYLVILRNCCISDSCESFDKLTKEKNTTEELSYALKINFETWQQ